MYNGCGGGGKENTTMALSKKQRVFVEHFLRCWNAAEAARRAGYSERSARHIGCENLSEGITRLKAESRYFINVGSIGQPRDDTNDAKYVIWDSSANSIEVRFVAYDIATVVRKIKSAGLPEEHAQRLW